MGRTGDDPMTPSVKAVELMNAFRNRSLEAGETSFGLDELNSAHIALDSYITGLEAERDALRSELVDLLSEKKIKETGETVMDNGRAYVRCECGWLEPADGPRWCHNALHWRNILHTLRVERDEALAALAKAKP
jgi:hypothetical protein